MKKEIILFLVVVGLASCSSHVEDIAFAKQDFKTITPQTVQTDLKVVNLIVNQREFDEMYTKYEEDIEIDCLFNLYKNGVIEIADEKIELQVKGNWSARFPLKSLGIKFDDAFSNTNNILLDCQPMPMHSLSKLKSVRLRNSGNDFEFSMVKDICYTQVAIDAGLNFEVMYTEQMVVFVNDQFLGLMNLRSESNEHGLSRLFGVKKSNITMAKVIAMGGLEKRNGDITRIDQLLNAIDNGNISYIKDEIDESSFIDYVIFESQIGNKDWPHNNATFYAIDNNPFRFVLFDLDQAAMLNLDEEPRSIIEGKWDNPITKLFNLLYEDEVFKLAYNERYTEILNMEATSADNFTTIVNNYQKNFDLLMPTQIDKYKSPQSLTTWYLNLEHLKVQYEYRLNALKNSDR